MCFVGKTGILTQRCKGAKEQRRHDAGCDASVRSYGQNNSNSEPGTHLILTKKTGSFSEAGSRDFSQVFHRFSCLVIRDREVEGSQAVHYWPISTFVYSQTLMLRPRPRVLFPDLRSNFDYPLIVVADKFLATNYERRTTN